ncbi:MAG: redox-sensing transcriptional repressor Rex [Planctomycetaceae bacterium]|jgi:redox-sensing transcriptional repressor|nr:redox-sensing transcriptional repressor Rex [Planctomycetaceae bacterium]
MFSINSPVSRPGVRRLPMYLRFARKMRDKGKARLSCAQISNALGGLAVQIRKDLAITGLQGKPKIGYEVDQMIDSIEKFLGWDEPIVSILIGVEYLGEAILTFQILHDYGLRVVAAFSDNPQKIGTTIGYTPVYSRDKLAEEGNKTNAAVCILAADETLVQEATDLALQVKSIQGVWNLSPVKPNLPPHIEYEEVRLGGSLALLTSKIKQNRSSSPTDETKEEE